MDIERTVVRQLMIKKCSVDPRLGHMGYLTNPMIVCISSSVTLTTRAAP